MKTVAILSKGRLTIPVESYRPVGWNPGDKTLVSIEADVL